MIASTEFKRIYFDTALGYLWSLARPLLLFAVLQRTEEAMLAPLSKRERETLLALLNRLVDGMSAS